MIRTYIEVVEKTNNNIGFKHGRATHALCQKEISELRN